MHHFSYDTAVLIQGFMIVSLGLLFAAIGLRKEGKANKILRYVTIAVTVVSVGILVWLVLNKEAFHWNYDIATGKPVDHYSTYGRCVAMEVVAIICNATATLLHFLKNIKT